MIFSAQKRDIWSLQTRFQACLDAPTLESEGDAGDRRILPEERLHGLLLGQVASR
jgi:hypothetical protein